MTITNTAAASVAANNCTILPDGSAFAVASFSLPKDHWLYAPREYDVAAENPKELPSPILTHARRAEVVSAIRYAIRGATMCGKETDFDPDALVQNAVYALCGPYGSAALAAPVQSDLITIRKPTTRAEAEWLAKLAHLLVSDVNSTLEGLLATDSTAAPDMTDAYAGAREDLSIWKKRALEAEALNRKFAASVNSPSFMGEPAALAQAGEYPPLVCDYCGALTPDPWHSSGMLHGKMSKHIHSCDACAARGAAQVQAMLAAAPRNATLYNPDDVAFPVQRCADGVDALPPELASIARPTSIAAVEVAAPSAPAREPLTNEQIDEIHLANSDAYERGDVEYEFYGFVRAIERHHGITAAQKGGKHGTE